jgi:hypothetical protein
MQSKQIEQRFLLLIFDIQKKQTIDKDFNLMNIYLVDHFIIFDTPKTEYIIRKNEFHRPTNAYVSRKSSPFLSHNALMTIEYRKIN